MKMFRTISNYILCYCCQNTSFQERDGFIDTVLERLLKKNQKTPFQKKKPEQRAQLPTPSCAHLGKRARSSHRFESPSSTESSLRSSCINTDHNTFSPDERPALNYRLSYNISLQKLPCLDLRISRDADTTTSPGNHF